MRRASSDTASISTRQFLIRWLRAFLAVEGTPPLSAPIEEEVDWNLLLQLAAWHRVMPLLYRSLRGAPSQAVPESVLTQIEAYVRAAAGNSLFLTGELLRLLKRFEAQGIPAIPFKGSALAFFLYGDPALRQFNDLDILLHQEDLPAAKTLMLSLGYQPEYQLTRRQEKIYLQNRFHDRFTLARGDTRINVELHWDIMPGDFPFHPDWKGIWERCEPLSLASATMTTLSPEDLLLFLCMHGSKHSWERLQWLCDVAQLVRCHATMDWGKVMEQAKTSIGQQMLFLGLFLANDILGTPIPRELEQKIQHDPPTARLVGLVKWCLFEKSLIPTIPKYWKKVYFHLQAGERVQDRIAYWLRFWLRALTTPTLAEWNSLPLPDPLFPLYYVFRPMRLTGKYVQRLANHIYARFRGILRSVTTL